MENDITRMPADNGRIVVANGDRIPEIRIYGQDTRAGLMESIRKFREKHPNEPTRTTNAEKEMD